MIDDINIDEPDWSTFDKYPPSVLTCACGGGWDGHSKGVSVKAPEGLVARGFVVLARTPCPLCGKRTRVHKAESPPESYTLRG